MTQLAERSGILPNTAEVPVRRKKHCVPSAALPGVADALDVSIDWLMTGEPAAMHPRSLLIAIDQLHQFINARPPRAGGEVATDRRVCSAAVFDL